MAAIYFRFKAPTALEAWHHHVVAHLENGDMDLVAGSECYLFKNSTWPAHKLEQVLWKALR